MLWRPAVMDGLRFGGGIDSAEACVWVEDTVVEAQVAGVPNFGLNIFLEFEGVRTQPYLRGERRRGDIAPVSKVMKGVVPPSKAEKLADRSFLSFSRNSCPKEACRATILGVVRDPLLGVGVRDK
jgi:hypothetical protein